VAGLAKPIKKPQNRQMTDQDSGQPYQGPDQPHKRIVSSSHVVSKKAVELSEVEYGLIVASNAFGMWIVKAMSVALAEMEQNADLGVLDILCLHSVNHRGRAKKLADICFKLNVEDSHTVNYALKKLVKVGLVQSEKQGKEVFYGTTKKGNALCMAYRDVRESCLVDEYAAFGDGTGKPNAASLSEVARQLRLLSGLYDQAARSASGF
jgi:predicted MarR family transcription regulator